VTTCRDGVEAEDAAAWALDAEPVAGVDMAAHVPTCPACQAAIAQVAPARRLREGSPAQPTPGAARAADRALARVRVEARLRSLIGTVAGAFTRVVLAVPDYLAGADPSRPAEPRDGRRPRAEREPPPDG
jgi:hypothetical protein